MNNRFSLKKSRPKVKLLGMFGFVWTLVFLYFSITFSFEVGTLYEGVYSCQKNVCTIVSYLPVSEIVKLDDSQQIIVNKQEENLEILKINNLEVVNNVAFQEITIKISKQNFYENQTVSFFLKQDSQNMWEILWQNLKGGDAL